MIKAFTISILIALVLCFQTANAEWVKLKTSSLSWLHDVTFVTGSKGWTVGSDGTILSTMDGGITWKPLPKFTTDTLLQIHFTDEHTGWLLCERNIFSRGQNATSYLRKTIDGGQTWERIEFENGGRERITKLLFNNLGWGTAFGEGGIFYKLQEDGKTWKKSISAIHFLLLGGSYSDGLTGAIAGAGGTILYTGDNGLSWEKSTLIGNTDTRFNSVFFASPKLGWAVGANGAISACSGGGRLWRNQNSITTTNLNDVYFTTTRDGWAVGDDGVIAHTTNGGVTWKEVNSRIKHRLEKIVFVGKRGFAVGFGGTILTYLDGTTGLPDTKPTLQRGN